MKKIIITILVVAVIALLAILFIMRNPAKDVVQDAPNNEIPTINVSNEEISTVEENTTDSKKKVLYFYNDSFIGYLENNEWKKAVDLKLSDIFDNDYYTVYNSIFEKSKASKVQIAANHGYGSFNYDGLDIDYTQDGVPMVDSPLAKYGTTNEYDITVLDLPVKLDEELAGKHTINLPDIEASSVKVLGDDFNYDNSSHSTVNLLSYNADYDVKFVEKTDANLPEDVKTFVDDLVVKEGLKSGVPYTLKEYYKCDLNNDGIEDEVFNLVSNDAYIISNGDDGTYNNRQDQASKLIKEYGGFSAVITKINGNLNVLYGRYFTLEDVKNTDYDPVGSTEVFNLTVADLNEDNVYEIIINMSGWEYWWTCLCVNQNEKYVLLPQIENFESNVIGDCIVASKKEVVLNNTSVEDIMEDINLDISKLELGDYKYIIGKAIVFNKECDIVLSFSVTDIDTYGNRMYGKQSIVLLNDNKEVLTINPDYNSGSSSIYVGSFTVFKDYLIHVYDVHLSVYSLNEKNENVISGFNTFAKVEDGVLKVSSYTEDAGNVNERKAYSKVYYKAIEENGNLNFEVENIDTNDVITSSET